MAAEQAGCRIFSPSHLRSGGDGGTRAKKCWVEGSATLSRTDAWCCGTGSPLSRRTWSARRLRPNRGSEKNVTGLDSGNLIEGDAVLFSILFLFGDLRRGRIAPTAAAWVLLRHRARRLLHRGEGCWASSCSAVSAPGQGRSGLGSRLRSPPHPHRTTEKNLLALRYLEVPQAFHH
jgi:hypothetical protein